MYKNSPVSDKFSPIKDDEAKIWTQNAVLEAAITDFLVFFALSGFNTLQNTD